MTPVDPREEAILDVLYPKCNTETRDLLRVQVHAALRAADEVDQMRGIHRVDTMAAVDPAAQAIYPYSWQLFEDTARQPMRDKAVRVLIAITKPQR